MSHRITLELPDTLVAHLELLAQRSHRNVETVLADSIGGWVASLPIESDVNDEAYWNYATIVELAEQQGVVPSRELREFEAAFWPDNESIDDLIDTVACWRSEVAASSR